MLQWMSRLLCKVGWHQSTWVYDSGPVECAQTSICQRCDEKSSRVWHDVRHWGSVPESSDKESGVCERCDQSQTRDKPYSYIGPGHFG